MWYIIKSNIFDCANNNMRYYQMNKNYKPKKRKTIKVIYAKIIKIIKQSKSISYWYYMRIVCLTTVISSCNI